MNYRIAVKRLTDSDLTLFEWHFRNRQVGNQKSINLNADVFVEELYPNLPELSMGRDGRVSIDLSIFGPGLAGLHNLQRKIIKGGSYKNWRLDGEFICNPDDQPDRFNQLMAGDVAVFVFSGQQEPSAADMYLVAAGNTEDSDLHAALQMWLGGKAMKSILVDELINMVAQTEPHESHPIWRVSTDEDIEEAARGDVESSRRLWRRRSVAPVSRAQLRRGLDRADAIGERGEEFVNSYLEELLGNGEISSFSWESRNNAVAPCDFIFEDLSGSRINVEVKSTQDGFDRAFHISMNELIEMARGERQTALFRVYNMRSDIASLRVASSVREFASDILAVFDALPEGVRPDSISVMASLLHYDWPDREIHIADECP